jgi:hypothetical protein
VIDAITGAGDGAPCPPIVPEPAVCGYPDLGVHDRRHVFFLDPGLLRQVTDLPTHLPLPVSSYPNLALSLHAYTHVYTVDALLGQPPDRATYPFGGLDRTYAAAEVEARAMGAALFAGEFGNDPSEDGLLLAGQLAEQERHLVGGTFWVWKENCSPATTWGVYAGVGGGDERCAYDRPASPGPPGVQPQSGCLRAGRERLLARVYPVAAAGDDLSFGYDPATGGFHLSAFARSGAADTLLMVPPEVRGPVLVAGSAQLGLVEGAPGGSRLVHVRPAGGRYTVTVAAAPPGLAGCA